MVQLLSGKEVAEEVYRRILLDLSLLPFVPKLAVVLVGNDPASQVYVRNKKKKCLDLGMRGETIDLPESTSEEELLATIRRLNADKEVTGILVQLPLPHQIQKRKVMEQIDPLKDVDALHPENAGLLFHGEPRFLPCTPAGVIEMLKHYKIEIAGRRVTVIGRSDIVGKPMAQLLLMNDATVTLCHSKTRDLADHTRNADIVVAAMGKPRFLKAEHFSSDAVVIDVGMHRLAEGLCGDVDFESVSTKCRAITPVPGGVGPMTIAMLMKNVLQAATLGKRKS